MLNLLGAMSGYGVYTLLNKKTAISIFYKIPKQLNLASFIKCPVKNTGISAFSAGLFFFYFTL